MPWTAVLSDLEVASRDSGGAISVLSVEPDPDKRRVRIDGESKGFWAPHWSTWRSWQASRTFELSHSG